MIQYSFLFLLLIFCSCGETEGPLSSETGSAANTGPSITMDMDEDLLLTIGVRNIDIDVSSLGFRIAYDNTKLVNGGAVTNGDYNMYFNSLEHDIINGDSVSVAFSGVSGTGELLKIQFLGSSYKDIIISLEDLELYSNGTQLDLSDESVNILVSSVCYIDEGIHIQYTENGGQPIDDWSKTGDYIWSNRFCSYF